MFLKGATSEQTGKHIRATSATRYAQTAQKPALSKSQSVEEIRKKAQVNHIFDDFYLKKKLLNTI